MAATPAYSPITPKTSSFFDVYGAVSNLESRVGALIEGAPNMTQSPSRNEPADAPGVNSTVTEQTPQQGNFWQRMIASVIREPAQAAGDLGINAALVVLGIILITVAVIFMLLKSDAGKAVVKTVGAAAL